MAYSYINKNGKKVSGRAADNHLLSEMGYNRLEDFTKANEKIDNTNNLLFRYMGNENPLFIHGNLTFISQKYPHLTGIG